MRDYTLSQKAIKHQPRFLWFLMLGLVMFTIFFNWFNSQIIQIAGLILNASIFLLPFVFSLSALIVEIYGYKHARRAVWCGLVFNLLFVFYEYIVTLMPSPDYPTNNALFDTLLTPHIKILFASMLSYFIAQTLNLMIVAKMKVRSSGQGLSRRFLVAISLSLLINSVLFNVIAFNNVSGNTNLFFSTFNMWFIANLIVIACLPVLVNLAEKLKRTEKIK